MTGDTGSPERRDESVLRWLSERRSAITEQLTAMEEEARNVDAGSISFGKRVGEGTSMAVERLVEVARYGQLNAELDSIRHAEERLISGEYGVCEKCGRPIPAERMEAVPYAVRCVRCADS